jgi:secreted trypsin-like serine protease
LTGGRTFFIDQYTLHPQYDDWTLDNDVAVMRMDVGVKLSFESFTYFLLSSFHSLTHFSKASRTFHLLVFHQTAIHCGVCPPGNKITVAGWGVMDVVTRQIPENLLQVQKDIIDHAQCDRDWVEWGGITSRMFCTNVENGIDSCQGDSGGAIIRNGIQVGIVSFGSEICGDGSLPAVYVRIEDPLIRDFIRQQTGI